MGNVAGDAPYMKEKAPYTDEDAPYVEGDAPYMGPVRVGLVGENFGPLCSILPVREAYK